MARRRKANFGMLSVKAGIDNNPNPTAADRIAGATKGKNKKNMKKNKASKGKAKKAMKGSDYMSPDKEIKFGKAYGGTMRKAQFGSADRLVGNTRRRLEKKHGIDTSKSLTTTGFSKPKPKPKAEPPKQTFGQAFAAARKRLGPGKTFTFEGKKYSTNRADDKKKPEPAPAKIAKKSATQLKTGAKAPTLKTPTKSSVPAPKSKKATRQDRRMDRKSGRMSNRNARAENRAGRQANRSANRNARKRKRSEKRGGNLAAASKMQGKGLNLPKAKYGAPRKKAFLGMIGKAAGAIGAGIQAKKAGGSFGDALKAGAGNLAQNVLPGPLGQMAGNAIQNMGQGQQQPAAKKGKMKDRRRAKAKRGRAKK